MPTTDDRLSDLLLEWEDRLARGEAVAIADLCSDCPELTPELEQRIEDVRAMNRLVYPAVPTTLVGKEPPISPVPSPDRILPEQVPGYLLLAELGRGGMGVVYKARDLGFQDRVVALKMIRADNHVEPEYVARFRAEAEAMARVQHPNIVQIFRVGEHAGRPFFVMEYIEGGSLHSRLRGRPLPVLEAAHLVEVLARAVHAAHVKGIIHRDLKPANILLQIESPQKVAEDAKKEEKKKVRPRNEETWRTLHLRLLRLFCGQFGLPKISDFGLARLSNCDLVYTGSHMAVGTPSYMAPEQTGGRTHEIGPATDVYGLGAILYELLTGRPPVQGDHPMEYIRKICLDRPVPPRQLRPEIPAALEAVCLRCLEKQPGDRYRSALALADDLRRFVQGEPVPMVQRRPARHWPRRWLLTAAGLAAVLAAVVVLFVTDKRWNRPDGSDGSETGSRTGNPFPLRNPQERIAVRTLEVEHWAKTEEGDELCGLLGGNSYTTRLEDGVRVRAELSAPAYCYLIAYRPDGTEELCFPKQDSEPPVLTDRLRYPAADGKVNSLSEGTGLEAFFVVVSRTPLPAYATWKMSRGESPWRRTAAMRALVWVHDGAELLARTPDGQRGSDREIQGGGIVSRLAEWLRQAPEIETVSGVGFPVLPR